MSGIEVENKVGTDLASVAVPEREGSPELAAHAASLEGATIVEPAVERTPVFPVYSESLPEVQRKPVRAKEALSSLSPDEFYEASDRLAAATVDFLTGVGRTVTFTPDPNEDIGVFAQIGRGLVGFASTAVTAGVGITKSISEIYGLRGVSEGLSKLFGPRRDESFSDIALGITSGAGAVLCLSQIANSPALIPTLEEAQVMYITGELYKIIQPAVSSTVAAVLGAGTFVLAKMMDTEIARDREEALEKAEKNLADSFEPVVEAAEMELREEASHAVAKTINSINQLNESAQSADEFLSKFAKEVRLFMSDSAARMSSAFAESLEHSSQALSGDLIRYKDGVSGAVHSISPAEQEVEALLKRTSIKRVSERVEEASLRALGEGIFAGLERELQQAFDTELYVRIRDEGPEGLGPTAVYATAIKEMRAGLGLE